ncbi:MAG: hypothetical protein KDC46_12370, partial [Thermoleophilia bacterium]|nr:hypothetical protein [Thermoleophilia bacterium]
MTSDHAFGSNELTPDLLRGVQFEERDGMIPAGEVRTFLENAASALDVLLSQDGITAMKREIDRSADIATQVLDAGQTAAEQLRRQAAEEAKRILDEARDATLGLRETVDAEIEQAREQVEAMRGTFIQDLRDLYDRIGASLYRFERAAEESAVAPIKEPARDLAAGSGSGIDAGTPPRAGSQSATPAHASDARVIDAADSTTGDVDQDAADLPEGAKPPAWRQLPAEAWSAADDAEPAAEPLTNVEPEAEPAIEPAAADPGPD